jgi:hypothetical protein
MRCRIRQGRIAGEILTRSEEMEFGPKRGLGRKFGPVKRAPGKITEILLD